MTRRNQPRWLMEMTAWAAVLVLAGGVLAAISIRDGDAAAASPQVAQVQKPKPDAIREVRTKVAVPGRKYVPPKPVRKGSAVRRPVLPELGPPPGPQYDPPPARVAAPEDRYAFLVGVTDYRSPTKDTIGSANDVRLIAGMLEANGWLPGNVRMITDRQVTGAAVRSGLSWLAGKSTPGTFTFFHYSGHVKQVGSTVKLWPVDRDFVPDRQMAGLLARGTGKMWVDIAGCEAGGFEMGLSSSRVLFSGSSTEWQKSYEYPQWGESVWTGLLFDVGIGQRGADANKNGIVTMGEALRYAKYYAHAITRGQRPHGPQTPQISGDPIRGWTLAAPPA